MPKFMYDINSIAMVESRPSKFQTRKNNEPSKIYLYRLVYYVEIFFRPCFKKTKVS